MICSGRNFVRTHDIPGQWHYHYDDGKSQEQLMFWRPLYICKYVCTYITNKCNCTLIVLRFLQMQPSTTLDACPFFATPTRRERKRTRHVLTPYVDCMYRSTTYSISWLRDKRVRVTNQYTGKTRLMCYMTRMLTDAYCVMKRMDSVRGCSE
jgi:hypothetical protein